MRLQNAAAVPPSRRPGRSPETALTLIEVIGVLAIAAVIASMAGIGMVAYYDQLARDAERATQNELAEAVRSSVTRDLTIPSQAEFGVQASRFSGISVASVLTNARGNPRYFLIDPGITNSGIDVPFVQTANPMAGAGVGSLSNLRLMIVSSVGKPYTNGLPTAPGGKPTATVFNNLWATQPGKLPSGVTWAGDPHDLIIQRLQLLDYFYMVSLSHAEAEGRYTNGRVRFPGMNAFAAPTGAPYPSARWCLRGTALVLSNAADASLVSEVITGPVSFTYEKGYWRRGMSDLMTAAGSLSRVTGADFERAVAAFLAAPTNTVDKSIGTKADAAKIVNAFSNYIVIGATAASPPSSANKNAMDSEINKFQAGLQGYTGLPPGQLNKP